VIDFEGAKRYAKDLLEDCLPYDLYFHSPSHTLDYVMPAAVMFARREGVGGGDWDLLKTAALFHDTGYSVVYEGHEDESSKIAAEILPAFGYSDEQVAHVKSMIMATKCDMIGGRPVQHAARDDLLQQIICDADMFHLGHIDFFMTGDLLRKELEKHGMKYSTSEWYNMQLRMLESHEYYTRAAKEICDPHKKTNIIEIKSRLSILGQ